MSPSSLDGKERVVGAVQALERAGANAWTQISIRNAWATVFSA